MSKSLPLCLTAIIFVTQLRLSRYICLGRLKAVISWLSLLTLDHNTCLSNYAFFQMGGDLCFVLVYPHFTLLVLSQTWIYIRMVSIISRRLHN